MANRKWTDKELIQIIQEKAKELGTTPKATDIITPNPSTFAYRFGSWNNALKMAGFEPQQERIHKASVRTKEELITLLYDWSIRHNRAINSSDLIKDKSLPSRTAICNQLGVKSWQEVINLLDLPSKFYYIYNYKATEKYIKKITVKNTNFSSYSKEDMIAFLQNWCLLNNKKITVADIKDNKDLPSYIFIMRKLEVEKWYDIFDLLNLKRVKINGFFRYVIDKTEIICPKCQFIITKEMKFCFDNQFCPACGAEFDR